MNVFTAVEECKNILRDNISHSVKNIAVSKITKDDQGYQLWYCNPITGIKSSILLEGTQPAVEFLFHVQEHMKNFEMQMEKEMVWKPIPGYKDYAMTETRPNVVRNLKRGIDLKGQKAGGVIRIALSRFGKAENRRADEWHKLTFPELY